MFGQFTPPAGELPEGYYICHNGKWTKISGDLPGHDTMSIFYPQEISFFQMIPDPNEDKSHSGLRDPLRVTREYMAYHVPNTTNKMFVRRKDVIKHVYPQGTRYFVPPTAFCDDHETAALLDSLAAAKR